MRKRIAILLLFMLAAFLPAQAEIIDSLMINGDFESVDSLGLPEGWSQEMWLRDTGVSYLSVEEGGADGGKCAMVYNAGENDARFAQDIPVEPDSYYRVSCLVKAEGCGVENSGAGISIRDTFSSSEYVYDTNGEWVELTLVGKTGPSQTSMGVLVRVGGYSSLNTGRAWFDDVRAEKLDALPAGVEAANFTPYNASAAASEKDANQEPSRNTEAYLLLTGIYILAVIGFARKKRRPADLSDAKKDGATYIAIMAIALGLRIILALRVRGYNTDVSCFEAWSERMFTTGMGGFYSPDFFCDYPPGYMILLWPAALLRRLFGAGYNSAAHILLIKLLPIACDLLGAHIVYRFTRERLGARAGLLLAAFYALNPAVFIDSAAWGQIDSVLTLLVVVCALEAVRRNYLLSLPAFALAVLVKPQALLFAPLGLAAVLLNIALAPGAAPEHGAARRGLGARLFKRNGRPEEGAQSPSDPEHADPFFQSGDAAALHPIRDELLKVLWGLLAALGLMYITALPFCIGGAQSFWEGLTAPVTWLFHLYGDTMSSYPYFSLNALNLYTLLDLNWKALTANPLLTKLSWILFGLSYVYAIVTYLISRERKNLFLCAGTLMVLICTFGPMIHERYVYPAILLLVLAYVVSKDLRVLISAVAITVTLFLNEILVLQGGMTTANYGHLQASEQWLNASVSLINVLIALLMLWTCFDLCVRRRAIPLAPPVAPPQEATGIAAKSDPGLHLCRWDYLFMASITLLYSLAAFVNLGSTTAPQTNWVSSASGEQIVFDLGETQTFRMTYYGGICNSTFTVELSNDGVNWTQGYYAVYDQGEIFRWLYYVPSGSDQKPVYETTVPSADGSAYVTFSSSLDKYPYQTARYVRLTAEQPGLTLSEVAFLDADGEVLPILALTRSGALEGLSTLESDPMRLMDEQDVVPAHPSYYNSTYFDEIYHARTAYEHLHGLSTYEWTHPPLGKVLMMVGIKLFGMTPFGWRFMGTLMGVLMLPVMYLLVKQLTKRTSLSLIAMFLLAVDSMHFTQTRIATIDSYAVFFIMVMYLFMFRYSQMSWNRQSLWRTLVPLGLCGLFMGFAWATKWIGLYASVGLALIFFYTLYLRVREYPGRNRSFGLMLASFLGGWVLLLGGAACAALGAAKLANPAILSALPGSMAGMSAGSWFLAMLILLLLGGACMALLSLQMQKKTDYQRAFWRNLTITIAFCLVMFVLVPALIYYFSYYWQLQSEGGLSLARVLSLQKQMLGYHAGLSGDTHYFRSPWYQWPVIAWPMWYYSGTPYMPAGVISSISCMGNPAVWWTGLAALLFVAFRLCWQRKAPKNYLLVIIGFASQFLPWVLVPRSTFIYHYFASVPFLIIAIVLLLDMVRLKSPRRYKISAIALCSAALILFVAFYPLESGAPVSRAYAMLLRWFNWYNF